MTSAPPKICNRCNGPFIDRNGVAACDCNPHVGFVRKATLAQVAKAPPVAAKAEAATVMPRDRSYWGTLSADVRTDIICKAVEILAMERESVVNRLERLRTFLVDRGHVKHNTRTHDTSPWIK